MHQAGTVARALEIRQQMADFRAGRRPVSDLPPADSPEWFALRDKWRAEAMEGLRTEVAYHEDEAAYYRDLIAQAEADPATLDD